MKNGEGLLAGRGLLVLFGLWMIVSPHVFGYLRHAHATQDTIVGILVAVTGIVSAVLGVAASWPLWTALALGVWTFITPMMFSQAGESFSANNDLIVGLLIGLTAAVALVSRARLRIPAGGSDEAAGQTSLR
jgi:hypothetical protein